MKNQHFQFLAPLSPHKYPSPLPSNVFRLHFSSSDHLLSWNFWKCAPRSNRKHDSKYSHKTSLIDSLTFWISKRPKSSPCWWWFSALSLCCSLLSPFIPSMPPKLDLKKRRKYVYYCYRWPPWATSMVYPTSFWWHLDVSNTISVVFWCLDIILAPFFTFRQFFFMKFLKMRSPPA